MPCAGESAVISTSCMGWDVASLSVGAATLWQCQDRLITVNGKDEPLANSSTFNPKSLTALFINSNQKVITATIRLA